jgi:tRNA pseudouridine55 synthase
MIDSRTNDFAELDFLKGEVILIDKPVGWTSFKVVHKIRKALKVKKVGHSGTLDPMATGLLILSTGRKTKDLGQYQNLNKTYTGTILLGKTSASMDTETELKDHPIPDSIDAELILSVRDEFLGEVEQVTPMYSAAKVNGRRLYSLARKGEQVERRSRRVFIEKFEIRSINLPEVDFEISCSKGTYIRAIANDFGEKLGCGAVLSSLRRIKVGEFNVDNALKVDDFLVKISKAETLLQQNG